MPFRTERRSAAGPLGASFAVLLLAGCAGTATPAPASRVVRTTVAVGDSPVRIGQPYTVNGRTYVPTDDHAYDEVGLATVYGEEAGSRTASGEAYRAGAITAAHPTLPLPSYVEVTALGSGRTILVRVNDRGPFGHGRIVDLSRGAAAALQASGGVFRVRVRRAFPPETDRAALRAGQAAAPRLPATEQLLAALNAKLDGTLGHALRPLPKLAAADGSPVPESASVGDVPVGDEANAPDPPPPVQQVAAPTPLPRQPKPKPQPRASDASPRLYVQLGAFADRSRAQARARSAGGSASAAGRVWRVRLGPFADRAAAADALARARARGYREATLVRDPATP